MIGADTLSYPLCGYISRVLSSLWRSARILPSVLLPGIAMLGPIKGLSSVVFSFLISPLPLVEKDSESGSKVVVEIGGGGSCYLVLTCNQMGHLVAMELI